MNKKDLEKIGLAKEALEKAGLSEDVLDKIIVEHGKDIEKHKQQIATAESERDQVKTQLEDANKQIADFKTLDVDKIKQAATDWEAKAKQTETEAKANLLAVKRKHALERELRDTYGVVDDVAVMARLNQDKITYDEKDNTFSGLKEQVDPLKEKYGSYFSESSNDNDPDPKLVKGTNGKKKSDGKTITFADAIKERLGPTQ